MGNNAQRHDDLTVDTIASALKAISPDMSREEWWRIAAALKSELGEKDGFDLFDTWSKTGSGYDAKNCTDTWKSTQAGGGVNIGTLIYKAQQNGWTFDDERETLTAEAIEKRRQEREAERRAAEAEKRRQRGEAAKLANLAWENAVPASDRHPYLQSKGVRAHGLGVGSWPIVGENGEPWKYIPDALIIPIADARNGKIVSLQGILVEQNGAIQKRYLKNGAKKGGFHMIGRPPEPGEPLAFCEGYATGATIHEITGWAVIVTFDAPNLATVAEAMRDQFPQAGFLICADNDEWSKAGDIVNPGLHFAERAAAATRGFVIAPSFTDKSGEPTDFNDLAQREGDTAARTQLLNNPISRAKLAKLALVTTAPADKGVPANDDGRVVDYNSPLPHVGGKGKPLNVIQNMAEICDRLGVTVRYNTIKKDTEIVIPGESFLGDTQRGASLARMKSECAHYGMATESLGDYLLYLGDKNAFNPVEQMISSKPWDGETRFPALLASVTPRDDFEPDLWQLLLRRWLISAVAAALLPEGFWSKGVLVFQGDQSLGKTSWFRSLMPSNLRDLIKVDASIDPTVKDTIISAVSHWLVELGELDGMFRKADIARLKGFISQDVDQFRRPYARIEENFPRRTVFFASVNPKMFLGDDTGNVRWWTIPVASLDYGHGIDMQQLWAEVRTWFEAGEPWWLERHEEARLEARNGEHTHANPIEERLLTRLAWDANESLWTWQTVTDVLISIGLDKPTQADCTKAGGAIRKANGDRGKRTGGATKLFVPPKLGNVYEDDDRPF